MRDEKSQNNNQANELAALVSNQSIPRAEMALYDFAGERALPFYEFLRCFFLCICFTFFYWVALSTSLV